MKLGKELFGKVLMVSAVVGMLMTPSCTQREVGTAAAVVAAGAAVGAVVILDDANRREGRYERRHRHPHPHRHRHPYPRPRQVCEDVRQCNTYYDRWGHRHQECGYVTRCRRSRHYLMALDKGGFEAIAEAVSAKKMNEIVDTFDFAQANVLSLKSAEKLSSALDAAKEGDLEKLEALGLDEEALESLAMLRYPSDETIEALSVSLNQQKELTQGMIGRMLMKAREYKKQMEDSEK